MSGGTRRDEARFRREFLAEAEGLLDQAADVFTRLRASADDPSPEDVNSLFRSVHSLKGVAGMVGLTGVTSLAHDLEGALDRGRMGKLALDPRPLDGLAAALHARGPLGGRVAAGETNPEADPAVGESLAFARAGRSSRGTAPAATALPDELDGMLTDYERHRLSENERKGLRVALFTLDLPLETFDVTLRAGMETLRRVGELIGTFPGPGTDPSRMTFRLLAGLPGSVDLKAIADEAGAGSVEPLASRPIVRLPEERPAVAAVGPAAGVGGTVRVPLEKIGTLLDLAGELARSRWALKRSLEAALATSADRQARYEVQKAFGELDRGITSLGRAALATRLVPVSQLTGRLSRAVSSLAPKVGKEVRFDLLGGETEVDKVLADELADPLLHLVRNAVDHGIEAPEARLAAGKPREGQVRLEVTARGRDVVFLLSDDGCGIDPASVVATARRVGLLETTDPDPRDPLELLFLPGFSTAGVVSEVSGRGVGLDVVRSTMAALKGSVSVRSEPGKGTTFEVVVPMTLVLVESLLVRSGGFFFAVPSSGVRRALRADGSRILVVDGRPVVADEDLPLPLVPLTRLLGLPEEEEPPGTIVVAEQGSRRVGILVSGIEGIEDVIVKPIADEIPRAPEVTGAAELPGGGLALALDTGRLLDRALRVEAGGLP